MKQKLQFLLKDNLQFRTTFLMLFVLMFGNLQAQQSIGSLGTATTQDFSSMGTSGTASLPVGFRVSTSNSWTTGTTTTGAAYGTSGTGIVTSSSGGNIVNWANGVTGSSTERALGFLGSGSFTTPRTIMYAFTNNTGSTVNSIALSFNYEKYRSGTRQMDWTFTHGATATAISTAATAGDQTYAADANTSVVSNPPLSVSKSFTVTGLTVANGTTYYLCWTYNSVGGSSSAQGLGLDDFSITLQSISNPTTTSISPSAATAGDPGFTITVNGTNFISGSSTVTWNGSNRPTTFVSSTQLTASITAADIANTGTANVGVTTTGATAASNTQTFTINAPASPSLAISGTLGHGSVCPTFAATPIQYTITNTGTAAASDISVGSSNPEFVVSGLSSTSIAGSGGTATFNVTFTPSSAGAKSATITVTSTTSGSNSPTASLTGTGTTPVTPVVTTNAASAINNTVATLNGNLGTVGVCPATTSKGFVYSQSSVNNDPVNGGTGVTTTAVGTVATGNFNLPLSSLPVATSYSYKAYVFDGTNYTYGAVQTFSTLAAANHLTLSGVPATGNVGVAISTFTVDARRPDNSVDTNYTGSVTVSKASGPGGLGGTLTVSAVAGVATFSTATFDAAGTYTISAASGALTPATSGNIVVTLAPVTLAAWNFTGQNATATSAMTTNDANLDVTSNLNLITRGPGAAPSAAANSFRTVGFQNDGISTSNTDYFQTTLKATAGRTLSLSSITAVYNGTGTYMNPPGVTSQYAYSLDGTTFTLIGSPVTSTSTTPPAIDLTGISALQLVPAATTVYIRYYASGQTSTGGWGYNSPSNNNGLVYTGNILCKQPTAYNVTGGGAICGTNSAPVGLSSSETGISYQLKRDGNDVGSPVAGTGSALDFGNQTVAGTYTVVATNTVGGCNTSVTMSGNAVIAVSNATTWTGAISNDWNVAGNWSCGSVPTASSDVTIPQGSPQPSITADAFANTLTLGLGTLVTVLSGFDLTVTGAITSNGGNLTVSNNANLIQVNDVANTGIAKVKRNSSALMRQDYTLWSSPVSNQNLLPFSPQTLTNRFYTYNTGTNEYNTIADPNATTFAAGVGYLIRMPNNHPTTPTIWNGEFNGTLRNGTIPVTLNNIAAGQRFNAVGNPYPSAISMLAFASDNSANITGTLYFWRKTNSSSNPSYCSWSQALGFVSNGQAQVFDPQGIIRTGQGFLVEASATGTQVLFQNSQRSGDNANQFFRNANEVERHRIWLNATSEGGAFSQTLIGYVTDATLDVDPGIDGTYFNDGDIAFYSLIGTGKYVIQGRPVPFAATDVVPMGFTATNAGTYSIAIDQKDGLFAEGQNIYLRDNLTNTVHDLNAGAYTFASEAGVFESRFDVLYDSSLTVDTPSLDPNAVIIYKENGQFVINSGSQNMSSVQVYDVLGKVLKEVKNIDAAEATLSVGSSNQVLLFSITTENGSRIVKKMAN